MKRKNLEIKNNQNNQNKKREISNITENNIIFKILFNNNISQNFCSYLSAKDLLNISFLNRFFYFNLIGNGGDKKNIGSYITNMGNSFLVNEKIEMLKSGKLIFEEFHLLAIFN